MMDWQPIETAPRDGSWFVILVPSGSRPAYEVGRYDPSYFSRYVEVGGGLYRMEEEELYAWSGFNNMHAATHWMPLPEPPEVTAPVSSASSPA